MMLCMARAYVEGYNPDVKLSQKQLIKMVHQIQPNEPLPKKVDMILTPAMIFQDEVLFLFFINWEINYEDSR